MSWDLQRVEDTIRMQEDALADKNQAIRDADFSKDLRNYVLLLRNKRIIGLTSLQQRFTQLGLSIIMYDLVRGVIVLPVSKLE